MVGPLCCPRDSQESPPTPQLKSISSSAFNLLYGPTLTCIHDYWKNHSLIKWTFVGKVMLLLFNMLSRFVIAFLPRSKHVLISWLPSPSSVIMESKKIKFNTLSKFYHVYLPRSDGTGFHDLHFLNVEFQANLFTLLFHFH